MAARNRRAVLGNLAFAIIQRVAGHIERTVTRPHGFTGSQAVSTELVVAVGKIVAGALIDPVVTIADRAIARFGIRLPRVRAFQQRILKQLTVNEIGKFNIVELQQLNRLLQLRRHDKRLGLAKIKPRLQGHLCTTPCQSDSPQEMVTG